MANIKKRIYLFLFLSTFCALFWFSEEIYNIYDRNRYWCAIICFAAVIIGIACVVFHQTFSSTLYQVMVFEAPVPKLRPKKTGSTKKTTTTRAVSGYAKRMVAAKQQWLCGNCKKVLQAAFEVDHIIALSRGGTNQESNLVALCRDCHGEKTFRERAF